jgi:DNA-binding NarL/FixJ family response regulator
MPSLWIIEDNAAFRRATVRALAGRGDLGEPQAFARCEEALERLAAGERPDVVLLDIGLPGIDGIEGIRRMKAIAPDIGIVVLTVFEDDDKIFRAVCAGASGYLLKSEPLDQVVAAIDQAAVGGSPMNPRVAKRVLAMLSRSAPPAVHLEDHGLNERERQVIELMVEGLGKKEIAARLEQNLHTIDYVTRCIYKKLHVNGVAAAVNRAVRDGIVKR